MKGPVLSNFTRQRQTNRQYPLVWIFLLFVMVFFQIFLNLIFYDDKPNEAFRIIPPVQPTPVPLNDTELKLTIDHLTNQLEALSHDLPKSYQDDGTFFPFTIRDAKRLSSVQMDPNIHIFDYVDTNSGKQLTSKKMQLWVDGNFVKPASCSKYSISCYKQKILYAFQYCLTNTTADYFFYIEADNDLCVPLQQIRNLAFQHNKPLIATGVGFSGWIMSRDFVFQFLQLYRQVTLEQGIHPQFVTTKWLMENKAWSVTRQYLVSHSILPSLGADPLLLGQAAPDPNSRNESTENNASSTTVTTVIPPVPQHLPRCLEPHRSQWYETEDTNSTQDIYGWGYFDFDDCPLDAEIYPCRPDQYPNASSWRNPFVSTLKDGKGGSDGSNVHKLAFHDANITEVRERLQKLRLQKNGEN
eukprot:Nitzschia sp. Nitz4//scaffold37_size175936//17512//18750//NITZ4_002026-RA/size175936-processed-gene-0.29-mRNA-1//1//CDS//3329549728//8515//frame0